MSSDPSLVEAPGAPLFARVVGEGAQTIVCVHSSTASHGQWRGLANTLSTQARVVTPDLHGHGRSPAMPSGDAPSLQLDAHALAALLSAPDGASQGIHLVGHSYGAAVALQFSLNHPALVRSLTLYEPVAFGVLHALAPADPALAEITQIAGEVAVRVKEGQLAAGASAFVNYWGGPDAWQQMSDSQREAVESRIAAIPRHFDSLFAIRWGGAQPLGSLTMPVLLMNGSHTRTPARRVAELLGTALPAVRRLEIAGAGHLGPMSHEAEVNAAIVAQLQGLGVLA